jgi:hypothetical protein
MLRPNPSLAQGFSKHKFKKKETKKEADATTPFSCLQEQLVATFVGRARERAQARWQRRRNKLRS